MYTLFSNEIFVKYIIIKEEKGFDSEILKIVDTLEDRDFYIDQYMYDIMCSLNLCPKNKNIIDLSYFTEYNEKGADLNCKIVKYIPGGYFSSSTTQQSIDKIFSINVLKYESNKDKLNTTSQTSQTIITAITATTETQTTSQSNYDFLSKRNRK